MTFTSLSLVKRVSVNRPHNGGAERGTSAESTMLSSSSLGEE
jgi:hypothetical protein